MRDYEEAILRFYKIYHSGKENAVTRKKFMSNLMVKSIYTELTDREFRRIYSRIPICTCAKGGFYPIRKEEIKEFRIYLRKKAIPLFNRYRQVHEAHSDLMGDEGQLGLFEEKIPGMTTFKENMKRWEREVNELIEQVKDIASKEGKVVVIKDGVVRIEE